MVKGSNFFFFFSIFTLSKEGQRDPQGEELVQNFVEIGQFHYLRVAFSSGNKQMKVCVEPFCFGNRKGQVCWHSKKVNV